MTRLHMPNVLRVIAIGIVGASLALAQTQIGTVTSSAPFRLRGATITPGEGVPSWPVLPGDTVKAGDVVTIVTFTDGSVVSLEPGADGNIDISGASPVFQLANGTVVYSLKSRTSVKLLSGDKTVTPSDLKGTYSRNGQRPVSGAGNGGSGKSGGGNSGAGNSGGFWTAGHTALVVGVGAATAAGLAVGVSQANSSGGQVSPSH